jgi:hypothetical protein
MNKRWRPDSRIDQAAFGLDSRTPQARLFEISNLVGNIFQTRRV